MKTSKARIIEEELTFLIEQLTLIKQQREIHEEMESILLKMKSLAEYRLTSNLIDVEIKNLNSEMQFYEAQYQFLDKLSKELYNPLKPNIQ